MFGVWLRLSPLGPWSSLPRLPSLYWPVLALTKIPGSKQFPKKVAVFWNSLGCHEFRYAYRRRLEGVLDSLVR